MKGTHRQKATCHEDGIGQKKGASDWTYTGVLNDQLHTIAEVEYSTLMLDHTFLTKEVLLLRITKEAILNGFHVSSKRMMTTESKL